jgi:hypothetical protein
MYWWSRRRLILSSLFSLATAFLSFSILYAAAHHWINAPASHERSFHDSFATGDLRSWHGFGMQQLCCDYSARVEDAPHRPSEQAVKFVLKRSDPDVKGSRRAELRLHSAEWDHEYNYAMRIFLPADWVSDAIPVTIVQWHNVPDLWRGEWGLPSVLRLDVVGDEWSVVLDWGKGPDWVDHHQDVHSTVLWHGPLDRQHWTDWVFRVKWSQGDDGLVEVQKDDALLARHVGPTGYNDALAPYLKIGLYVPTWKIFPDRPSATDRREIWFSDVQMVQNR